MKERKSGPWLYRIITPLFLPVYYYPYVITRVSLPLTYYPYIIIPILSPLYYYPYIITHAYLTLYYHPYITTLILLPLCHYPCIFTTIYHPYIIPHTITHILLPFILSPLYYNSFIITLYCWLQILIMLSFKY